MLLKLRCDPANANLTGFASNVTGAGPWTMSATSSADGLAHQVSVRNDSATNHGGKTLTLTGTDANGLPQVETMAGPGGTATVESTKYFLTLATVAVSSTIGADTFDIGWVDEWTTPSIPLDWRRNVPSNWFLDVTGTISLDVDFAIQDIGGVNEADIKWAVVSASLDDETADSTAFVAIGAGYTAARVRCNSYTDTAEVTVYASQPEAP